MIYLHRSAAHALGAFCDYERVAVLLGDVQDGEETSALDGGEAVFEYQSEGGGYFFCGNERVRGIGKSV